MDSITFSSWNICFTLCIIALFLLFGAFLEATGIANLARYRARSLPAVGALLKAEDSDEKQISLMD